jgi:hypothetical protein
VLDPERWRSVLDVAQRLLVTPVGPCARWRRATPDYKPTYDGDLRARDAAYHQGHGVGLAGGAVRDAWLKVIRHDKAGIEHLIEGFAAHLGRGLPSARSARSSTRRSPSRPARLRRAGVERRRGAADPGEVPARRAAEQLSSQQPAADTQQTSSSWSAAAVHA